MIFSMKEMFSLGCAGFLCLSMSVSAYADTPAQTKARREIAAAYAKMERAMKNKDLATIASLEAPDFQMSSITGGTRNRAQDLALTRSVFPMVKAMPKMESKILSLKWRGPDAIVMCQTTAVVVMVKGGKTARLEEVDLSRDYWSQNAGVWQIRQSVEKTAKMWINGKRLR